MKKIILLFCATIAASACSKPQMLVSSQASGDAPIEISANWIKSKGDKADIKVTITNKTAKILEIHPQDVHCMRDSETGFFRHEFVTPPYYGQIRLSPNETRTNMVFCDFKSKTLNAKNFALKVDKIYEADGKDDEKSKKIAENVNWTFTPSAPTPAK